MTLGVASAGPAAAAGSNVGKIACNGFVCLGVNFPQVSAWVFTKGASFNGFYEVEDIAKTPGKSTVIEKKTSATREWNNTSDYKLSAAGWPFRSGDEICVIAYKKTGPNKFTEIGAPCDGG